MSTGGCAPSRRDDTSEPHGWALGALLLAAPACRSEAYADGASTAPSVPAQTATSTPGATAISAGEIQGELRTIVLDRDAAFRTVAPGLSVRRARVRLTDGTVDEWRVLRLDLRRVSLTARAASANERVSDASTDPRVLAAVDGGYFDPQHRPAGTLISDGVSLAPFQPRGGSGLLLLRDRSADVLESTAALGTLAHELAVQCGPRLIERDGSVGIYRDDGQRYARTAACVRDQGRTLDLVTAWLPEAPMRGPGLLAFSRALAQREPFDETRGCERALNLDGGPSTGLWVRGHDAYSHEALGPTPWLLVVRAR